MFTNTQLVMLGLPEYMGEYIQQYFGKYPVTFTTWQGFVENCVSESLKTGIVLLSVQIAGELSHNTLAKDFETWALVQCILLNKEVIEFVPLRPIDTPVASLLKSNIQKSLPSSKRSTTPVRQLEMVNEVSRNIAILHDVREILNSITDQLLDRFGYYHASVGLIEGEDIIMYEASPRSRGTEQNRFRIKVNGAGTLPWVARHGETRLVHDTLKDTIWIPGPGLEASRSELTVPMKLHGKILGIIDIQSKHPNAFDETDVWLIEALASQLGIALQNAALVQELSQQAEQVTALLETSKAISAALPEDTRFNVIVQRARELFNADNVVLFELEDEQKTLRPLAAIHSYLNAVMRNRLKIGEGLTGHVVSIGKGMIVNAQDKMDFLYHIPGTPVETECLMSVPLQLEGKIIGAITIIRESENSFQQSDLRLLEGFASLVSIGLNNARLVEMNMRQRERAEALNRVARSTGAILNLDEVLKTIIELLPTFIQFETAIIGLMEGERLEIAQQIGYEHIPQEQLRTYFNQLPMIKQIVQDQNLQLIATTSDIENWSDIPEGTHIQSWIGVPLTSHGYTIGVLAVASVLPNFYSIEDANQLLSFANQIALAIDNARLYEAIMRREKRATTLYEVTRHLALLDAKVIPLNTLQHLAKGMPFHLGVVLLAVNEYQLICYTAEDIPHALLDSGKKQILQIYEQSSGISFQDKTITERVVVYSSEYKYASIIEHFNSRLFVPLKSGRDLIGGIALYHGQVGVYDDLDLRTLHIIGNAMATALENAWLVEELKARAIYLQEAYDELAEADRLKDELVQNVSHELRTPLTFIKGYVELFLEDGLGPLSTEQHDKLNIVAKKTDTLIRLVSDIVSSQKLDRHTLNLETVQLGDLIEQTVMMISPTLQQEQRHIHLEINKSLPPILGDIDRINQILNNLIFNALKFSSVGTDIIIRAFYDTKHVRVEVEDQGIGISESQQERIFERFYQADGTTKRRYGGIGLGLAISKQIVQAHEGQIGVRSTLGKGSCFYFELPIYEHDPQESADKEAKYPEHHR